MISFEKDTVYQCVTLELAQKLLKQAHAQGYNWAFGDNFIQEHRWDTYRENTCYEIVTGHYSNRKHYDDYTSYKIIQVSEKLLFERTDISDEQRRFLINVRKKIPIASAEYDFIVCILDRGWYNYDERIWLNKHKVALAKEADLYSINKY